MGFARTTSRLLLLGAAITAHAQTSRGTVTGTVLDPTGAVVRGAHITLKGVDTGVKLSTVSNDGGVYLFDAVLNQTGNRNGQAAGASPAK